MTNQILAPLHRSLELSRRIAGIAGSAVRLGPTLAFGAYGQLNERMPRIVAQQLPARAAEVDALEARIARLEAAAAAPAAATGVTAPPVSRAARTVKPAPKAAVKPAAGRRSAR